MAIPGMAPALLQRVVMLLIKAVLPQGVGVVLGRVSTLWRVVEPVYQDLDEARC